MAGSGPTPRPSSKKILKDVSVEFGGKYNTPETPLESGKQLANIATLTCLKLGFHLRK